MELWVLSYRVGNAVVYITPDAKFTDKVKGAVKFFTEQCAKDHLVTFNTVIDFSPEKIEIDDN